MPISLQNKPAMQKAKPLSERLGAIAALVPEGALLGDIGSDHATLPIALFSAGRIRGAIVTDIHSKPLGRAKTALSDAGFDQNAAFYLTDGIRDILQNGEKPDAFVIAGMSGETMAAILAAAAGLIPMGQLFLLQPMTGIPFLRGALAASGICLEKEIFVAEREKIFVIFAAHFVGISRKITQEEAFLGDFLRCDGSPAARAFCKKEILKLDRKIRGREKAGIDNGFEKEIREKLKNYPEE